MKSEPLSTAAQVADPRRAEYDFEGVLDSPESLAEFFATEFGIDRQHLLTERDGTNVRVRCVAPAAEGLMEVARFGSGCVALLMDAVPQVASTARIVADGTLFVRLLVAGDFEEQVGADQPIRLSRPVCTITYLPAGHARTQWLRPGQRRRYFGLAIRHDRLLETFGWSPDDVPGALSQIYRKPHVPVPLLSALSPNFTMMRIFESVLDCGYTGGARCAYFLVKSLELLIEAVHAHPIDAPKQQRPGDPRLARAAAWIDAELASHLTLEAVGHRVGLNRNALTEGFRESFGLTFHDYVLRARMRHAWRRLGEDGAPVGVVADETGFRSRPSFSSAFVRFFGVTPKSVKRS